MATVTGKDGAVYIGGSLVGEVRDFSIEQNANRVDDTVMGDEWTTGKVTQRSWSASINIYYDPAAVTGLEVGALIAAQLYPQGKTTGLKYYEGNAHITSLSTSASFDGMVEASLSVEGTGSLAFNTV